MSDQEGIVGTKKTVPVFQRTVSKSWENGRLKDGNPCKDSLSANMSKIEEYTFFLCDSLKSVTIPNSVTHIGKAAFDGYMSLSQIERQGRKQCLSVRTG